MKNIIKTIGIIAFVAVMGLGLFTSCEEPEEITLFDAGAGNAQTVVTITGIDNTYNGKVAIIGIDTNPMGLNLGDAISEGTVSGKILNSDSAKAAYAEGYYTVALIIYNSTDADKLNNNDTLFEGGAISVEIKKGESTVAFSEFKSTKK